MHSGKLTFRLVSTFEFIIARQPPQSIHIYLFVTAVVSLIHSMATHIHIPNHTNIYFGAGIINE